MCNAFAISSTLIRLSEHTRSRNLLHISSSVASDRLPDLVSSSKDVLLRLNSPTQNLTCAYDGAEDPETLVNSQCISWPVYPFKYKYLITARYSTFDEKFTFASLAMFDIQYLMSEWHDKGAILPSSIKHYWNKAWKSWVPRSIGNGIGWLLIDLPSYLGNYSKQTAMPKTP